MKLTKFCLLPWRFMQVHAGGMMQCCGVAADMDEGDFLLDYCENPERPNPFDGEGLQMLRRSLLTGNLRPMCRNCFFAPHELVTTEEFRRRLIAYLSSRKPGVDFDHEDLTKVHAFNWLAVSFTNRCNLSCIYCVQSCLKNTNPYFKMEFPYEYAREILELYAKEGGDEFKFSTCVEGEATLYPHWYELFSEFHRNHPKVRMVMTTNLNRRYSEEEFELLAAYKEIDVSIESVDEGLYSFMRRNGRLNLVLENVDKLIETVQKSGKPGPRISFHTVLSDKSWPALRGLADYAFARGIALNIGNYERRPNTVAVKEDLLHPVSTMPYEEQVKAHALLQEIKAEGEAKNIEVAIQGDIFTKLEKQVERAYNEFRPYDDRELIQKFYGQFPKGTAGQHLAIAYDADNISHEGIWLARGETLRVTGLAAASATVREVEVYRRGRPSSRYDMPVKLGYRKKLPVTDGVLEYTPAYANEDIDHILLEVL